MSEPGAVTILMRCCSQSHCESSSKGNLFTAHTARFPLWGNCEAVVDEFRVVALFKHLLETVGIFRNVETSLVRQLVELVKLRNLRPDLFPIRSFAMGTAPGKGGAATSEDIGHKVILLGRMPSIDEVLRIIIVAGQHATGRGKQRDEAVD